MDFSLAVVQDHIILLEEVDKVAVAMITTLLHHELEQMEQVEVVEEQMVAQILGEMELF